MPDWPRIIVCPGRTFSLSRYREHYKVRVRVEATHNEIMIGFDEYSVQPSPLHFSTRIKEMTKFEPEKANRKRHLVLFSNAWRRRAVLHLHQPTRPFVRQKSFSAGNNITNYTSLFPPLTRHNAASAWPNLEMQKIGSDLPVKVRFMQPNARYGNGVQRRACQVLGAPDTHRHLMMWTSRPSDEKTRVYYPAAANDQYR